MGHLIVNDDRNLKVYRKTSRDNQIINFGDVIGKNVRKQSNKPFKSGNKMNTVRGIVQHKETPNFAFIFEEDDSEVECWRCVALSTNAFE